MNNIMGYQTQTFDNVASKADLLQSKIDRLDLTAVPKIAASRVMTEAVDKIKTVRSDAKDELINVRGSQSRSVSEILKRKLNTIQVQNLDEEQTAFFVADLGEVVRQHQQWLTLLPRVEPFFAIKCNPDEQVLKTLRELNTGFDCASKAEIAQVLALGVDPSRIIFANPCKQISHIRYAVSVGVRMMTFDNADELEKIKKHSPNAQLVIRILVDDSKSVCKFGVKFGASLQATQMLLEKGRELGLEIIGVSFHVGSGCFDEHAFVDAVSRARKVFDQAEAIGYKFHLLDIGGGFPGANSPSGLTFNKIASLLGPAIDKHFPNYDEVRVIAEPGRYYVHSAYTLACSITSRRIVPRDRDSLPNSINTVNGPIASKDDQPSYMYYINDGVYGSFNCILFDHVAVTARPLYIQNKYVDSSNATSEKGESDEETFYCSIWGPTCDSMDCLTKTGLLPKMDIGDWLVFDCMGAYTMCAASEFNGFKKSNIIYTNTADI